jgi:MFS family permease
VLLGSVFQFFGMLGGGWWSDRVGRRVAMIVPSVVLVVWAPVFFWMAGQHSTPLLLFGVFVGTRFRGMLAAPRQPGSPSSSRPATGRPATSLVFQGSSIIAGALASFIAV